MLGNERGSNGNDHSGNRTCNERTNRCRGQRSARTATFGHAVSLHRRDQRTGLTRRVHQNRCRGAAIHRTVVNAGKENHRSGHIYLRSDRQQHGHHDGGA